MSLEELIAESEARYRARTPRSLALNERAEASMVMGGSHSLRLFRPYPFFKASASGALVTDVDGNVYIDYWQGHYANVLGHNPDLPGAGPVRAELHTGFEGESQVRLAELILASLGWKDHKIRFTTSGTLATMYAVMLGLAHTGRDRVLKIGGGWHGSSPLLLKGVKFHPPEGYQAPDSAGLPAAFTGHLDVVSYNDEEQLEAVIRERGDRIACFILEPFLGAGGFIPASPSYLKLARRLTAERGIVLIFDEIVSGFRFAPTAAQTLYGIEPDLSALGKVIGGGHAVAAVAGKAEILEGCRARKTGRRVLFDGGTFSAHGLYMSAGAAMLEYLTAHAGEIYPRIGAAGERLRRGIEKSCRAEGLEVFVSGDGNEVLKNSSFLMAHFPKRPIAGTRAEDFWNPEICDSVLREESLRLLLCLEGVHTAHGGGVVSAAHEDAHIERTIAAYGEAARAIRRAL